MYLLVVHGNSWKIPDAPSFSAAFAERVGKPQTVPVVIPARNEAAVIGRVSEGRKRFVGVKLHKFSILASHRIDSDDAPRIRNLHPLPYRSLDLPGIARAD